MTALEEMIAAYKEAIFFTEEGVLEDSIRWNSELSDDLKDTIEMHCRMFLNSLSDDFLCELEDTQGRFLYSKLGHDFWLTRNGHGAGFWDGDWGEENGKVLTELARSFGEFFVYLGNDDLVYGD